MNPSQMKKTCRRLGIGVVMSVIFLFLLEMALQIIHLSSLIASDPGNFINTERLKQVSVPRKIEDPVLGHRPNPDFLEHDAKGFRNAGVPEPGQVDLVALGDSQTYGANVHRTEAWPQQLEGLTGLRVYNLSFGGYSPAHYLFLIDEALAFKPKKVITAVYFGNDILESFLFASREQHRKRFSPKDPQRFEQAIRMEKETPITRKVNLTSRNPESFLAYENTSLQQRLARNLKTVQYAMELRKWFTGRSTSPCGDEANNMPSHAAPSVLTPQYRLLTLDQRDIRVQEGLRITQEALATLDETLNQSGVDHLVMLIPTKERVYEELVLKVSPTEAFLNLMENEKWAHDALIDFMRGKNIAHLSLLPALKKSLWVGKTPYQNSNDGHPSREGQRAIAECIADYFAKG